MMATRYVIYIFILLVALVYRAATGLHPYSGEGNLPLFGDYEAQRHWMELTLALAPKHWYEQTVENDLQYWGLDYPPLSAYASKIVGWCIAKVEPESMALHSSRGYESPTSRALMRLSVLVADILVLFPALIAFVSVISRQNRVIRNPVSVLIFVLSLPALILIDHGHFQYNGVSLGLFVASVSAMGADYHSLGAMLFCTSVYFKQLSMYFGPAIAAYLLGSMISLKPLRSVAIYGTRITLAVMVVTAVVFAPWIPSGIRQILRRLFPVSRGLYEDKVANVWCTLSLLVKWNQLFSKQTLLVVCAIATVLACIPFCVAVAFSPSMDQLLLSSAGCSLAAFLFSYHVHEKQILIPLIPIALLADYMPATALWASLTSTFSLFPLLDREGLGIAYYSLTLVHVIVVDALSVVQLRRTIQKVGASFVLIMFAVLHMAKRFGPVVPTKPDLYTMFMTSFACANFCALYLILLFFSFERFSRTSLQGKQHIN